MKKLFYILFVLIPFLSSCEDKETEGISRVTYYADVKLEGSDVVVVTAGNDYVEPGFSALEGEEDITDIVEVSGSVLTSEPGAYELTYSAENQDGFSSSKSRLVLVVPEGLSSIDLGGTYTGVVAIGEYPSSSQIIKLGDGVFRSTDFFGGRYNIGFGYGAAYRLETYFVLNDDNTYTALKTNSPWGPWDILNGVYDPVTQSLSHAVNQGGFGFDVELVKE